MSPPLFFLYILIKLQEVTESHSEYTGGPFQLLEWGFIRTQHHFCLWRDNLLPLGVSICPWVCFPSSLLGFSFFLSFFFFFLSLSWGSLLEFFMHFTHHPESWITYVPGILCTISIYIPLLSVNNVCKAGKI